MPFCFMEKSCPLIVKGAAEQASALDHEKELSLIERKLNGNLCKRNVWIVRLYANLAAEAAHAGYQRFIELEPRSNNSHPLFQSPPLTL